MNISIKTSFIPFGFEVVRKKSEIICKHRDADIYALLFQYFSRSSKIDDNIFADYYNENNDPVNTENVYIMVMVILTMIRHGLIESNIAAFLCDADSRIINCAIRIINHYKRLFCSLTDHFFEKLTYEKRGSITVSFTHTNSDVFVRKTAVSSKEREIWYGSRIKYNITESHKPLLVRLLRELTPYSYFNEGQFESLMNIANTNGNSLCIMPTGSGKSLIFYLLSYLQPMPCFIIAPTDILITDQIRNLKEICNIDDAVVLRRDTADFKNYEITNHFQYITPLEFQNRDLLSKCFQFNNGTVRSDMKDIRVTNGARISYVFLDEVHCVSEWGHDFRPEYLMLTKHLQHYLSNVRFSGFTATASLSIIASLQKKLLVSSNAIFSPIEFSRYNISYHFLSIDSMTEMAEKASVLIADLISKKIKSIIFTEYNEMIKLLTERYPESTALFAVDDNDSYLRFISGKCDILLTTGEMGIGVSLPDVRCIIHLGMPLSKNEYVQEIGRGGRAKEHIDSYVYYLPLETDKQAAGLLQRGYFSEEKAVLSDNSGSYYGVAASVYPYSSSEALYEELKNMYQQLSEMKKAVTTVKCNESEADSIRRVLYMLYCVGYIRDWYDYGTENNDEHEIMADICSNNAEFYKISENMTERMKSVFLDFLADTSGNDSHGYEDAAEKAVSADDMIKIYARWFFEEYIYRHKESFLDTVQEHISAELYARCSREHYWSL